MPHLPGPNALGSYSTCTAKGSVEVQCFTVVACCSAPEVIVTSEGVQLEASGDIYNTTQPISVSSHKHDVMSQME